MKYWYLIHTRPGQEQRAHANLAGQGYRVFHPLVRLRRRRSQGMVTVTESLFPRYLFIQLDDLYENWSPIRNTPGVACMVRFGEYAARVPRAVIEGVTARMGTGGECVDLTASTDYRHNERVRVIDGPFRDLEGVFVARRGDERVVVLLNLLQKNQEVRLPEQAVTRA